MAAALCLNGGRNNSQLTRSLERILEEAALTGELPLSGRNLKEFPKAASKYDLYDTVSVGKFANCSVFCWSFRYFRSVASFESVNTGHIRFLLRGYP